MLTDNKEDVKPAVTKRYYNLEQIYSKMAYEDRLRMQRIRKYALALAGYIQRNRLFVKYTGGEFFSCADNIFSYTLLDCAGEDMDRLIRPEVGRETLKQIKNIMKYRDVWWDGTNAPAGEKGEGIPFSARLAAVAIRYEELVREQSYEPDLGNGAIIEVIQAEAGTRFQQELVLVLANCRSILQKLDIEFGVL